MLVLGDLVVVLFPSADEEEPEQACYDGEEDDASDDAAGDGARV